MGGGLMQLVAYGAQDIYLTGNPQMTFFKTVYRRHTNFSMEHIKQSFKGTVGAGNRVVATLARNGDLVHDCFIKVPGYESRPDSDVDDNPGHNMLDYIELEIGGQLIDKHYGHWMEVHAELTEPSSNSYCDAADFEAGKANKSRSPSKFQMTAFAGGIRGKADATIPDTYVPLRFWFNRHIGLSLPLIALQYHEVNIIVKFTENGGPYNVAPADNIPVPSLWCNYIYLDTDERRRFAQVSHEYLIEQVQMQAFTANQSGDTLKLNFNHPVKELLWAATATATPWGTGAVGGGSFYALVNISTSSDNTWQLKLNGHDRFEKQSTTYFTRYQPMKYHTSIATGAHAGDTIGVYSFALKPEEHQPSGTCNFSRIDNSQLIYTSITSTGTLYVYAVNYNVLRIMSGMGGLAYSN